MARRTRDSQSKTPSAELSLLTHADLRRYVEKELGFEEFLPAYKIDDDPTRGGEEPRTERAYFAALCSPKLVKSALKSDGWDIHIGHGRPGLITHYGEREVTVYRVPTTSSDFVPLVHVRSFEGVRKEYVEISEEFRLYYNLYHETKHGTLQFVDDRGDLVTVAKIEPKNVQIRMDILSHFAHTKRAAICVFFEFKRYSTLPISEVPTRLLEVEKQTAALRYRMTIDEVPYSRQWASLSMVMGKKFFLPKQGPIVEDWQPPADQARYAEFLVRGKNGLSSVSCDPERLSDYYGKNRGKPHYLTPVFFDREVLTKYHANPSKYSVDDGIVRCAGLWDLRIDNNHATHVVAYLGDLGHLAYKEQSYWKSYNVEPQGTISEVEFRRGHLAIPTEPESVDLRFKQTYRDFVADWDKQFSEPLFLPLEPGDAHCFEALRRPLNDSQSEFDAMILGLVKTLVDSLNEAALEAALAPRVVEGKGIAKLEAFLMEHEYAARVELLALLRGIQSLRSTGVAHRKGSNYRKAVRSLEIDEAHLADSFVSLLLRCTEQLIELRRHFLSSEV